jgi:thiol-disulfide isomerase/thioredoxin
MRHNRFAFSCAALLAASAALIGGCNRSNSVPAPSPPDGGQVTAPPSAITPTPPADDRFVVPQGTAGELLSFIERLASPPPFQNELEAMEYQRRASTAISDAADRILAGDADAKQAGDAVGWKLESLRIMEMLGDSQAEQKVEAFFARMGKDPRPAARGVAARARLLRHVGEWGEEDSVKRVEPLVQYAADIKANGLTLPDANLLLDLSQLVLPTAFPTSDAPAAPYRELLPLFLASEDPEVSRLTEEMAGTVRRLELPGNKLELEGELLDGTQFDWNAYRGKVVLVDFWATTCGECFLELPNVRKLFAMYHEQGFEVLGINMDNDRGEVKRVVAEWGIQWPSLFHENPEADHWDHPVANKLAIKTLPQMLLVNQEGVVVNVNARGAVLDAELKKLLGEPKGKVEADDTFNVPDGTPTEILAFVGNLGNYLPRPTSMEEQRALAARIQGIYSAAADKVLAADPTAEQADEAIQLKLQALQIGARGNTASTVQQFDEFLTKLEENKQPAVAGAVAQFRMMLSMAEWREFAPEERIASVDRYVAKIKEFGPSEGHARIFMRLGNLASSPGDKELVERAVNELLPLFRESDGPGMARGAARLEGAVRRMNLPGAKMELEGKLMDGTPLDWESYRGKVVLVDFWASWCGPCREEVPNVLRNYQQYRDKGFEVLGICMDDDRAAGEEYMKLAGVTWPSLFSDDPEAKGKDHPMALRYAVTGIPLAILVDREGKVVSMLARGPLLGAQLEQLLGDGTPTGAGTELKGLPVNIAPANPGDGG